MTNNNNNYKVNSNGKCPRCHMRYKVVLSSGAFSFWFCFLVMLGTEKDVVCLAQAFVLSSILLFPRNHTGFQVPYVLHCLLSLCQSEIYSLIWFLSLFSLILFLLLLFGSLPNPGLQNILANKGQLNYMKSSYQQAFKRNFTHFCYSKVVADVHDLCI